MTDCVVCNEVITQPLCAACMEHQVATWLSERCPERPELRVQLADLRDELGTFEGVTSCIKCCRPMSLCSYCYTSHLFPWIRREVPLFAEEFLLFFVPATARDSWRVAPVRRRELFSLA